MFTETRRYDIDWLRVIAIGLLLIYHVAIAFQPWGVFIGFMQNNDSLEGLWTLMSAINIWRISLLFFVSGMGVAFAMRKRTLNQLLGERTRRILIPFVAGSLLIVPLHLLLWQHYYSQDLRYIPSPGHLWFLGNIFIYVLVFTPLFYVLKKWEHSRFHHLMQWFFSNPLRLLLVALPFMAEAWLVNPDSFELYALTIHGFAIGLLAFFFGYLFIALGDAFWLTVLKGKYLYLALALALYATRLMLFELKAPNFLMAFESVCWIFALLGLATRYLNKPNQLLSYLSAGAYPIYILHMLFLFIGTYWILPLEFRPSQNLHGSCWLLLPEAF